MRVAAIVSGVLNLILLVAISFFGFVMAKQGGENTPAKELVVAVAPSVLAGLIVFLGLYIWDAIRLHQLTSSIMELSHRVDGMPNTIITSFGTSGVLRADLNNKYPSDFWKGLIEGLDRSKPPAWLLGKALRRWRSAPYEQTLREKLLSRIIAGNSDHDPQNFVTYILVSNEAAYTQWQVYCQNTLYPDLTRRLTRIPDARLRSLFNRCLRVGLITDTTRYAAVLCESKMVITHYTTTPNLHIETCPTLEVGHGSDLYQVYSHELQELSKLARDPLQSLSVERP